MLQYDDDKGCIILVDAREEADDELDAIIVNDDAEQYFSELPDEMEEMVVDDDEVERREVDAPEVAVTDEVDDYE